MVTWEVSLAWGQVNSLVKRFAGGRSKLCMVPAHSCYIYVTWNSKEMGRRDGEEGGGFKAIIWVVGQFYRMQLTTLGIMLTIFSLVIALLLTDDVNHHMHLFLTCIYLFFCHTQTIKIKVIDSPSSKNKLNSTFVVDGMTSNLALISDRHKIKSAPEECISLGIPHATVVRRHKIYSFLIIQVVFTFCGCTSSQLANLIS